MRLTSEIDHLKRKLLDLTALVEDSVRRAVSSIEQGDRSLADDVIEADSRVDQAEVELEEDCLKVLALHQPVAIDLRYIIAILKINNDIERIGDMAVNIAKRSIELGPGAEIPPVLIEMAEKVRAMLRGSLDALVEADGGRARKVLAVDDEVDAMHRSMYKMVGDESLTRPQAGALLPFLTVSRNLERIADLATNIAEDVIYLVEGAIVRHQHSD